MATCQAGGSSPLTRGKHLASDPRDHSRGLIPAHAGKTIRPRLVVWENVGSSPLTRGKLGVLFLATPGPGLIPAHAGKTSSMASKRPSTWAHPRSRGENIGLSAPPCCVTGSSPLTRGKPNPAPASLRRSGLIPAHAGKTSTSLNSWLGTRAHPRSRGENVSVAAVAVTRPGSSPLTRGKRFLRAARNRVDGLIPAHAGKTPQRPTQSAAAQAHPRSRGENFDNVGKDIPFTGSSPLTRGKHRVEGLLAGDRGLIPAHAGKTLPSVA